MIFFMFVCMYLTNLNCFINKNLIQHNNTKKVIENKSYKPLLQAVFLSQNKCQSLLNYSKKNLIQTKLGDIFQD